MLKRTHSSYGNPYVMWTDLDVIQKVYKHEKAGENVYIPEGRVYDNTKQYSKEIPVTLSWDYDDFKSILGVTKSTLYKFSSFLRKKLEETRDNKFDVYYEVIQTGDYSRSIKTQTIFVTAQAYKFCMLYAELRKPALINKVEEIFEPWGDLINGYDHAKFGGKIIGRVDYYDSLRDLPASEIFDENGQFIAPIETLNYDFYHDPW